MKLREYTQEEVEHIYAIVENSKDWSLVSCSGLQQSYERNILMLDRISFPQYISDDHVKNAVLNSINNGEKPNLISVNGCHDSFYMYELNGIRFFTNSELN